MSFWTAVVIIAAICGIVQLARLRHGVITDEYGNETKDSGANEETRREIEELRERIKVLERIATDANTLDARETRRIAEEIEKLRSDQQ